MSGGALADGTSACGLRLADQPAPTAPVETISFVSFGDGKEVRVEEGWAAGWSGEKNALRRGWPRAREHYLPGKKLQALQSASGELGCPPSRAQAGKLRPEQEGDLPSIPQ